MKRMMIARLAALAVCALPMIAARAAASSGTCDVKFHVGATMHKFTGTASCDPVALQWKDDKATLDAQVEVVKMTTGNPKRDKEMVHMFNAGANPLIKGHAAGVAFQALKAGDTFPFTLEISGQAREMTARVESVENGEGGEALKVAFDVSLKAFGLAPPKVLFFKVHDIVRVEADFQLAP